MTAARVGTLARSTPVCLIGASLAPGAAFFCRANKSGALAGFLAIKHLNRLARHDGGDGMLVDKLRMPVAAKQHAEIVERGNHARQFDAVYEEDCEWILGLSNRVQEQILKILRAFRHFFYLSPIPMKRKSVRQI